MTIQAAQDRGNAERAQIMYSEGVAVHCQDTSDPSSTVMSKLTYPDRHMYLKLTLPPVGSEVRKRVWQLVEEDFYSRPPITGDGSIRASASLGFLVGVLTCSSLTGPISSPLGLVTEFFLLAASGAVPYLVIARWLSIRAIGLGLSLMQNRIELGLPKFDAELGRRMIRAVNLTLIRAQQSQRSPSGTRQVSVDQKLQ